MQPIPPSTMPQVKDTPFNKESAALDIIVETIFPACEVLDLRAGIQYANQHLALEIQQVAIHSPTEGKVT